MKQTFFANGSWCLEPLLELNDNFHSVDDNGFAVVVVVVVVVVVAAADVAAAAAFEP